MRLPPGRRSRDAEQDPAAEGTDGVAVPAEDEASAPAGAETRRSRRARTSAGSGDGLKELLTIFYRVSRIVFLLLALACALGVVFVLAPTNEDNSVVKLVMDVADGAAGPFRDVFTADDDDRELMINYGFAAVVYVVASALVTRLPGGKR